MYIYPYKRGSASVVALATALNARVIRLEGSAYKGNPTKIVINWGNSMTNEEIEKATLLNHPDAVKLASNKLNFFEQVKGVVNIPPYTTSMEEAKTWLDDGKKVLARESLTGHSGKGIVILDSEVVWGSYNHSNAKVYVKYVPKKHEFRVHVVNGEAIDLQRKAPDPRHDAKALDYTLRNHQFGFIFVRDGVREMCPPPVIEQALLAVSQCGLHFGAVDVIWNEYQQQAYVLEVNTAPGLEGQSVDNYKKAFVKFQEDILTTLDREVILQPTIRSVRYELPRPSFDWTESFASPNNAR